MKTRKKAGIEEKKKELTALCSRSSTSSKHELANNGLGPVYPPLFGPCEEACGHVSSRVLGDRIKRERQKGSRRCTRKVGENEGRGVSGRAEVRRAGCGPERPSSLRGTHMRVNTCAFERICACTPYVIMHYVSTYQ